MLAATSFEAFNNETEYFLSFVTCVVRFDTTVPQRVADDVIVATCCSCAANASWALALSNVAATHVVVAAVQHTMGIQM